MDYMKVKIEHKADTCCDVKVLLISGFGTTIPALELSLFNVEPVFPARMWFVIEGNDALPEFFY